MSPLLDNLRFSLEDVSDEATLLAACSGVIPAVIIITDPLEPLQLPQYLASAAANLALYLKTIAPSISTSVITRLASITARELSKIAASGVSGTAHGQFALTPFDSEPGHFCKVYAYMNPSASTISSIIQFHLRCFTQQRLALRDSAALGAWGELADTYKQVLSASKPDAKRIIELALTSPSPNAEQARSILWDLIAKHNECQSKVWETWQPFMLLGGHADSSGGLWVQGETVDASEFKLSSFDTLSTSLGWHVFVETCFANTVARYLADSSSVAAQGFGHRGGCGNTFSALGDFELPSAGVLSILSGDIKSLTSSGTASLTYAAEYLRSIASITGGEACLKLAGIAAVLALGATITLDADFCLDVDFFQQSFSTSRTRDYAKIGSCIHELSRKYCSKLFASTVPNNCTALILTNVLGKTDSILAVAGTQYALAIDGGQGHSRQIDRGRNHYALLSAMLGHLRAWDLLITHADEDHIVFAHALLDSCVSAAVAHKTVTTAAPPATTPPDKTSMTRVRLAERLRHVIINTPWGDDTPTTGKYHRTVANVAAFIQQNANALEKLRSSVTVSTNSTAGGAACSSSLPQAPPVLRSLFVPSGSAQSPPGLGLQGDHAERIRQRLLSSTNLWDGIGSCINVKVLGPTEDMLAAHINSVAEFEEPRNDSANKASCAFALTFTDKQAGTWQALIVGDATISTQLLDQLPNNSLHAVQLSHHGSSTSFSKAAADMLVQKCTANAVLFMQGSSQQQNYPPRGETVKWLAEAFGVCGKAARFLAVYNPEEEIARFQKGAVKRFMDEIHQLTCSGSITRVPIVMTGATHLTQAQSNEQANNGVTISFLPADCPHVALKLNAAGTLDVVQMADVAEIYNSF